MKLLRRFCEYAASLYYPTVPVLQRKDLQVFGRGPANPEFTQSHINKWIEMAWAKKVFTFWIIMLWIILGLYIPWMLMTITLAIINVDILQVGTSGEAHDFRVWTDPEPKNADGAVREFG
ncbi:hypothetical protein DPMN_020737 [Dreissena polymorpha]|uniref:Uncharacterized protein n=1 Tax=Dreissena polymorpha TaxID=45954 RepID=A0A9D4NLK1_DREPO|nr:hypothetical protein DPMN_020737 [Dreissena polymorpha]